MITVYKKFFLMLGVTVLLCLSASVVWSETWDDLIQRNGLFYKRFTDVPYTGKTTGVIESTFKNGKLEGYWIRYYDNGKISSEGKYKNHKKEGVWISYHKNGQISSKGKHKKNKREGIWFVYKKDGTVWKEFTGNYKDGVKVSNRIK